MLWVGVAMCPGAGPGRGQCAQTHRAPGLQADPRSVCSCGRPWGERPLRWWACCSDWGCCCVNWVAWRAPSPGPRRTGSVGVGDTERGSAEVRLPAVGWRSGFRGPGRTQLSVERCHWRRGQAPDPVSLQPQAGMGSPQL